MKIKTVLALALLSAAALSATAGDKKAETAKGKKQAKCPVMERYDVDPSKYIDIKGYRIYTCCKGCINQIKANPDKYIKKLKAQGVELEKAPAPKKKKQST